jgi:UDP-glucose 4-epimerase
MKTICITGCNGYMGLALSKHLVDLGHSVIGIGTSKERNVDLDERVVYEVMDVRDTDKLTLVFKKYKIDLIYHLAGIKYVGKCESNPEECFAVNTGGTEAILAAMKEVGVPKIIFASTYAVYEWEGDSVILTEESKTEPKTVYGQSKLKAEQAIMRAEKDGTIKQYQILRFGNIIGTTDELSLKVVASFIDKLVQTAKTGGEVTLSGSTYNTKDGTSARDYLDIKNVIDLMASQVESDVVGVFNVSSNQSVTLKEIVDILEKITGNKIAVSFQERNQNDPSVIKIDNTKIIKNTGWNPKMSMEDTLRLMITKTGF